MRAWKTLASAAIGATVAVCAMALTGLTRPAPVVDYTPLGDTLPALRLQKTDGSWQDLRARLGGKPAILYVYNPGECLGCSDVPTEFRVIRRQLPALQPLLIGIGAPPEIFADPLREFKLDGDALIDEHNTLLKALGVKAEPLVIVVSASGRILFTDVRSTRRSSRYPLSVVLQELVRSIDPSFANQTSSLGGR